MNNVMTPFLTKDFEKAAALCTQETVHLSRSLRRALMDSARAIPLWQPQEWPLGGLHNCYNFAANCRNESIAFPGTLGPAPRKPARFYFDTRFMHEAVHEGALHDGFIYLGDHFGEVTRADDVAPVALFMRSPPYLDFHWLALRRQEGALFWAHVPGQQASAMRLPPGVSIFTAAADRGYDYFGGYYGLPRDNPLHKCASARKALPL
jgi:hypothetical protein